MSVQNGSGDPIIFMLDPLSGNSIPVSRVRPHETTQCVPSTTYATLQHHRRTRPWRFVMIPYVLLMGNIELAGKVKSPPCTFLKPRRLRCPVLCCLVWCCRVVSASLDSADVCVRFRCAFLGLLWFAREGTDSCCSQGARTVSSCRRHHSG